MPLTHLECPGCGGTLSLTEGQRMVACRYCGGKSLALIPGAVPRYTVPLEVTSERAREAATRFLRDSAVIPRPLRERGRIESPTLCYVPFYEISGTRLGAFLLREHEKTPAPVTEGDREQGDFQRWLLQASRETQDTRVVQQEYVRIGPACDLAELGVDRIRLDELRRGAAPVPLEGFDLVELQRRAVVFAPAKSAASLADDTDRRIPVRGERTAVVERQVKLLYYPVWQARFTYQGRPYEIAIDGVRGTILRARLPRELGWAAWLLATLLAVSAVCFGRPARGLILGGMAGGPGGALGGGTAGLVLGGAAAACLAWIVWTAVRQPGELLLVEGEEAAAVSTPGGAGGLLVTAAQILARPWFRRAPSSGGR